MDTIFALSTPPGKSGVAVLRVSGPAAKETFNAFGVALPSARIATLAEISFAGQAIDRGLVLFFPAPASFTGEDMVEYHVHGSRAVIRAMLAAFAALPSLRAAGPGEFASRAFLNGKFDLTAAEGLADLIDSETEAQRRQAMRLMRGDAARFYDGLRADIIGGLAALEAYIDFPDEDIPHSVLAEITRQARDAVVGIEAQLRGAPASERIRDGVQVAIIGPPNAGKSSLVNALAERDVAIVSHTPGTTRDVIEVHMDLGGYAVTLADTAGMREGGDSIEREGIRRSQERAQNADIMIIMFDATQGLESGFHALVDSRSILVAGKSDLGPPSPLPAIAGLTPLPVSVRERTGMDALLAALTAKIADAYPAESSFVTQARHRAHLESALVHLKRFLGSEALGIELRCEELRRAATEIGKITGAISVDEILGHIFGRFCIGK